MISIFALVISFLLLYLFRLDGTENSSLVYTAIIFLFTIAFAFDLARSKKLAYARGAIMLGYFWRIFLLYFDIYGKSIYILPNSGQDSVGFYREAVAFASFNEQQVRHFFPKVMGIVFRITGNSQLFGQFLILLCSIVSIILFAWMLAHLDLHPTHKRMCVYIISLLPNYAILSSIFLRESPVSMLLTLSIIFLYLWMIQGKAYLFVISFIFTLLAALFHSGSIAASVGLIAVLMLFDSKRQAFHFTLRSIIPVAFLSLLLIYLYLNYGDLLFSKMIDVDSISDIGSTQATGGSTYVQYVGNSATPLNMVVYTIPRIVYFLFSPFPWQWRGSDDIIAFLFSSMFYFTALIRAIRYLRSNQEKNRSILIALLIVALCTTFVFAWGVTNTGTATRHREKMVILYGLIYAISSSKKDKNIRIY